jgi:EmrB/QacA subfamily drug resistance transporter
MQQPDRSDRWVLFATILGSSLVFIDGFIVALALPSIQRELHATASDAQWVVEAYTLVLGSLMLFGGALGDRAGRRRIFTIGIGVFALGSLACAFAQNATMLVTARVLQGFGGMLLAPASLALIGAHFSGVRRDRAFASWAAYGALTSSIGPAVGGLIVDHFGWRAVFFLNIPLAALVMWAAQRHISESRDETIDGPLDILGAALATFGFGAITYALIASSSYSWESLRIGGTCAAGVLALAAFVGVERRARVPIMPLALFASRTFSGVNAATLLLYGALGATFYYLPFIMIQGHGYSATATAIAQLPLILGLILLARLGTFLMRIIGARIILTIGPSIVAIGFALLGFLDNDTSYWIAFFPGLLVVGIGLGLTVAPLTATVIDSADPRHIGSASGINNAISRIAGLLAVAALGLVLWVNFNAQLDHRLDAMHASPAIRVKVNTQRAQIGAAQVADAHAQAAILASFRAGFSTVAYACATLSLLAGLISATAIASKPAAEA